MTQKSNIDEQVNRIVFQKALLTGICGGILWSILWFIMHYFSMIKISPTIIWEKLFFGPLSDIPWYMYILMILLYGMFSMLLAIIYYICFKRISHWTMGGAFGLLIWLIGFILIPLAFQPVNSTLAQLDTQIGLACLSLLYGLFIGYSISFDFENLHRWYSNHSSQ